MPYPPYFKKRPIQITPLSYFAQTIAYFLEHQAKTIFLLIISIYLMVYSYS